MTIQSFSGVHPWHPTLLLDTDAHDEGNADDIIWNEEPEPSIDEILEAARRGERIDRPTSPDPVIGSQRIVRADVPAYAGRVVWRCACGMLATGWHLRHGEQHAGHELDAVEQVEVGDDYYEYLASVAHGTRLDKWLEWGPDEWRTLAEFPNYEMNGYDRHVRRREYQRTLKNGTIRSYPAREVKARKSSVTLSRNGVASTRGIEKLWKLTFPEYWSDPNSWDVKSLRRTNIPEELGRVIEIRR